MTLEKLLTGQEYSVLQGKTDIEIKDVIYDSRKVSYGCAFVALKGFNVDGHKFIPDAINKGATALIVEEEVTAPDVVTVIKVENTRKALALMSVEYFEHPADKLTTIAITGTKGKTTTVAMIRSILQTSGIKTGTIGTLGILIDNQVYKTNNTTPESYEIQEAMRRMVNEGCKAMVIEASSLGLKSHRTDGVIYDYGIFTNFSNDHIGESEHKDLNDYLKSKALLFKQCKIGIINKDDENAENILIDHSCDIVTYGIINDADLKAKNDKLIADPGYIGVHFETEGIKNLSVNVPIPGRFSVYNALSAIALTSKMGISDENIIKGINDVKVKGRVEAVPVKGNYTILIDYAHNAMSMENVLSTLKEYKPKRLITLFGAGGNRPKDRRYEMGEVSGKLSDLSVITEDNSRFENVNDIINDILVGMKKTTGKYEIIPNRYDAIKFCIENAQDGDIIVLAGKGHEDYQEIKGVKYHMDEREIIHDILYGNEENSDNDASDYASSKN